MTDAQPANAVAACNGLCGQNGWAWSTWFRVFGIVGLFLLFIMQAHGYMDHGHMMSNDIKVLKSDLSSMQADLSLIKEALISRYKTQAGDPVDPPLQELRLKLQNTGSHFRGRPRQ